MLLSMRCHISFFSSFSLLLSPLIWRILPSCTSTFTSSFFSPGRSALKTWASGVSFQSIRMFANWDVSCADELGTLASTVELKKLSANGSQTSRENGSKTLVRRPPKKLGMSDTVLRVC
ncbi:hypothetical protein Ancab_011649 [Ancistrocladus abbreviatus]